MTKTKGAAKKTETNKQTNKETNKPKQKHDRYTMYIHVICYDVLAMPLPSLAADSDN